MLISTCPLRVSLLGGGTDLPSFYSQLGGACLGFSIKKMVSIIAYKPFNQRSYCLKYSVNEKVNKVSQIKHPIFRKALELYNVQPSNFTSESDIISGSGLGSSSAFSVALIQAIKALDGNVLSKTELAEAACNLEINHLKMPIGKQDQYLSALGGMNHLTFEKNGKVKVTPIKLSKNQEDSLFEKLLMIKVGGSRQAKDILYEQSRKFQMDEATLHSAKIIKELCDEFMKNPIANFEHLGWYLNEAWSLKRTLTSKISSDYINQLYDTAIANGALGGKLLGAGGAGFFLLVVPKEKQKDLTTELNLPFIKPRIHHDGASFSNIN